MLADVLIALIGGNGSELGEASTESLSQMYVRYPWRFSVL